jgi:hypothetical protein
MGVLGVIIFVVWDVDSGLFRLLHSPFLGETPILGATSGSMWEWYFRSGLDHWSTFLGMVFALNFPITSLFYRKLEAQPFLWHFLAKFVMGAAIFSLFVILGFWTFSTEQAGVQRNQCLLWLCPVAYVHFLSQLDALAEES